MMEAATQRAKSQLKSSKHVFCFAPNLHFNMALFATHCTLFSTQDTDI